LLVVSAFAFLAPSLMFGANTSCPGLSPGDELGNINNYSPGNGFSGGLSTGGCFATDQTFGNFGISGFSGATPAPTLSNTDGYTTADATSDAQDLITNLSANTPAAPTGETESKSGDLTLLTQFGPSGGPPATDSTVNGVLVTVSDITLSAAIGTTHDTSVAVTVYVCENPTSNLAGSNTGSIMPFGTSGACSGAGGTLVQNTFDLINTGGLEKNETVTVAVNLGEAVDAAAVDVNIDLTSDHNSTNLVSFSGVSLDFTTTTPEPAPFVLVGSALVGLGLIGARRRKAQRAS